MFTSQYRLSGYEGLPEMAAGGLACHCLRAIPHVRFAWRQSLGSGQRHRRMGEETP
jgi:hypothetical protein